MRAFLFFATLLCCSLFCKAQKEDRIQALSKLIAVASTDSLKVVYLGQLSDYYYTYKLDGLGDSALNKQLFAAENSRNNNLVLYVLFGNAITNINQWSSAETFIKAEAFIKKGLSFAKALEREDYTALAYARLADLYKKKGDLENAFVQADMAFATALNNSDDSVRAITAIQLADVYQEKHQSLIAFKTYNNAYDLALKLRNDNLQAAIYTKLSVLYRSLGNTDMAKEYLFKSLDLHTKLNNVNGQIEDYLALVNLTDEKEYLDKATALLPQTNSEKHKLLVHRLTFAYKILYTPPAEALRYFQSTDDIKYSYANQGVHTVYWKMAEIYMYGTPPQYDSALYYFKLAEPGFETNVNINTQADFYAGLAAAYENRGDKEQALINYQKALNFYTLSKSLSKMITQNIKIGQLYKQQEEYKLALQFTEQGRLLKDSLQLLNKERDVVLLEVNRENKKLLADAQKAQADQLRLRNLQYMGITIAIAAFFLFLIVMGMFPVSKFTIKVLSFFAFICLFEFIVLLIDSYLHHATHGEPLKIWLVKIFLIAMLVPFQHFLEHAMTHFLTSEKLMRMRQNISLKKWIERNKKTTSAEMAEPDITVL